MSGLLAAIVWTVPVEAGITIIFWIGLIIVGQSFTVAEPRHYPAAIIGLMPGLTAWVIVLANSLVAGLVTDPSGATGLQPGFLQAQAAMGNFLSGGLSLQQGFLLTAMLWSAITVFIVDRQFARAAICALVAAGLSALGLMHGYRLESGAAVVEIPLLDRLTGTGEGWIGAPAECAGYLLAALIFIIFQTVQRIKGGQARSPSQESSASC
jgi:AGZA family xanthine/uracil permease-like MFS transporter